MLTSALSFRCEFLREGYVALRLVVVRTKLCLKRHVLQVFETVAQRPFEIVVPEEPSVIEASPQNAFVTRADEAVRVAIDVHDGDESRLQSAFAVADGEVALMMAHHCRQDFLRQLQIRSGRTSLVSG